MLGVPVWGRPTNNGLKRIHIFRGCLGKKCIRSTGFLESRYMTGGILRKCVPGVAGVRAFDDFVESASCIILKKGMYTFMTQG
jgi:hypothetical protein